MTILHRPVPSGSNVPDSQFADTAPVTSLPDPSGLIRWFVDDEGSVRVGFSDDALTAVDIVPILRAPVGGGLDVLLDEQEPVDGYLDRVGVTAHQVLVTGRSEGSLLSFTLEVKGATSLGSVTLGGHGFESAVAGDVEVVPELLQEALDALAGVRLVAREEDCAEPSDVAIENAGILIREMFALSERTYDVYPMGGGEIAIDVGNRGRRIGVFCYPDGKVQYVVVVDDDRGDVRRDDVNDIPTGLLARALNLLDS